ncbi:hypothetical protein BJ138DRAFT_422818 [Hygrophoropsis aurantiaca]|uniref:Uncharacterized protein n=1 Tax=Hygrophoropsis aurantiaca TaxID=72124 RepID=A0ACB8A3L1_9AGAM|nr:hypothetical protein BJ138DRAFT_422818 [Hygrophoropsis aurantiaca]
MIAKRKVACHVFVMECFAMLCHSESHHPTPRHLLKDEPPPVPRQILRPPTAHHSENKSKSRPNQTCVTPHCKACRGTLQGRTRCRRTTTEKRSTASICSTCRSRQGICGFCSQLESTLAVAQQH